MFAPNIGMIGGALGLCPSVCEKACFSGPARKISPPAEVVCAII
jgi:hypothetical protein